MITILSITICAIALGLLIVLTIIDLRERLLPNIYVFPFAVLGVAFHTIHSFSNLAPLPMILGGLAGGGILLLIRTIANAYYQKDTLGLGDVKLMAAGGLWLGIEDIFFALSLGAAFGVLHGIIYARMTKSRLVGLAIPAGPGFIAGLILTFAAKILWT